VAVPAGPGTAFEVVEAEAGLEFAVVVFDAPAACGELDQVGQGGVGGQIAAPLDATTMWTPRPHRYHGKAVTVRCAPVTNEINISGPVLRLTGRAGFPPVLGHHRVLHPGRWRPLRALGWMFGLIFVVAVAFGVWSDVVGSLFPSHDAGQFAVRAVGALLVLGVYAVAVRLGENRAASEIAPRPALKGVAIGLVTGVLLMAVVMAILAGTGLYDVTFLGATPAWHAAGLAIQAGVFEELLIRAVLFRLVWRAFGPWVALAVSEVPPRDRTPEFHAARATGGR